ncbi:MAG: HAMP domain-containing protein [Candidatus Omnitrophica bacterium]|nr:HAMP domain-containing protein [Candidatus Omnitrophota bacterium]
MAEENKRTKFKLNIRLRTALFFSLVAFIVMVIGIGLGYFNGNRLLYNTVTRNHFEISKQLTAATNRMIDEAVKKVKVYSNSIFWKLSVRGANLYYESMDPAAVKQLLLERDKEWIDASPDGPLIKKYLGSTLSRRLAKITVEDESIAEIFITDKEGGLVASSRRTSDFYQADEEWWQEAFSGGDGRIFIGDVEFDKSAGVLGITIASPVKNSENEIIGICKAVVGLKQFLKPLQGFKIGETGHVVLVDRNGYLLYHRGIEPQTARFISRRDFQNISSKTKRGFITTDSYMHNKKIFITYAQVDNPLFLENRILWWICLAQSAEEVFRPTKRLLLQGALLTPFLILIIIFLAYKFSERFIEPIETLLAATEKVGKGDLDYEVKVKTDDELGILANSFGKMAKELKSSTVSIERLNREIAERKEAETALKEAYDKLKQLQTQLIQADKMKALGVMVSGVAHEVKNPMAIILQGISFLEKLYPEKRKDISDALRRIQNNAKRADEIVRGLIDFSRTAELKVRPDDINSVLSVSLDLVKHRLEEKGIEATLELREDLPKALIDRSKIEQVFINVFFNAIQSMPTGGKLLIRSYQARRRRRVRRRDRDDSEAGGRPVVIEIEDTGIGIPEEHMDKIFDPFFTTKSPRGGIGLGLSVTKNIIDAHKGLIKIQSEFGKGTRIIITLKTVGG